jgi:dinuclear metal center YbgI/SA1388 family protein
MSVKTGKIISTLEQLAPLSLQEDWDNSGLQVGSPSWRTDKILLALDITPKVVEYAIAEKCGFILSHHPLIFHKISRVDASTPIGSCIAEALTNRICIYAMHTNLDVIPGGVSDALAALLQLNNIQVLDKGSGNYCKLENGEHGLGRIGLLPEAMTLGDFAAQLANLLGCPAVKVCGEKARIIKRVAVCGGSGGDLVTLAHYSGADVMVTGDVGHHTALDAAGLGLALVDPGHYASEYPVIKFLKSYLHDTLGEIAIIKYPGTDPFWIKTVQRELGREV